MPASPLDILWAAVELADEGQRDERGFLTEKSQAAVSAALAELPPQQAQLSLAEQEFLGDILMAWVSTGTTNAQGLKGWRDDATGEYRYQEIQPGTRKPGQEEPPGEPRVKKPEEAPVSGAAKQEPQQPKGQVPEKKEPAQPKKPELNPQAQALLKQHQAAAQKDAQDPKHAVNRFKDQLADFTPPGGVAIKTVQSTREKPLTAEDHQQVALFHDRLGKMMHLMGQPELAASNKAAAALHGRAAAAKLAPKAPLPVPGAKAPSKGPSAKSSWSEALPDEATIASGNFKHFDSGSQHALAIGKISAGGKDYFYKGDLTDRAIRVEAEVASFGQSLGIPVPVAQSTKFRPPGGTRDWVFDTNKAILTGWVDGETMMDWKENNPDKSIEDAVQKGDVDRQLFFSYLMGIGDRHGGNYMVADGRLVSVDHEYSEPGKSSSDVMVENDLFQERAFKHYGAAPAGGPDYKDVKLSKEIAREIFDKAQKEKSWTQLKGQEQRSFVNGLKALRDFSAGEGDTFGDFMRAHEDAHF